LAHGHDLSGTGEELPFIGTLIKRERDLAIARDAKKPKKWR
jgi:hypothetical protein